MKAYSFQLKPYLLSVEYHSKTGETFVRHVMETQGHQVDAHNAEELRGVYNR